MRWDWSSEHAVVKGVLFFRATCSLGAFTAAKRRDDDTEAIRFDF